MRKTARNIIVVGAAGVAFAAAGVFPTYALAASGVRVHPDSMARRFGTISSIEGTQVTLTTKDGATYTVDTSAAHVVRVGEGALDSGPMQVGDHIAVMEDDGEVMNAARSPRGVVIGGTLVAVASGTMTLMPKSRPGGTARPAVTIETNTSTVVTRAGQQLSTGVLAPGASVIVSGTREPGSTDVLATKVIIRGV